MVYVFCRYVPHRHCFVLNLFTAMLNFTRSTIEPQNESVNYCNTLVLALPSPQHLL
jgi:hypothetical protein